MQSALPTKDKLAILADAAKYDASCTSSSGTRRNSRNSGGIGSTSGICHSYTPDGRCIFDCAYCINRGSSNGRRMRFTVAEVVNLTLEFYKRNYIEGLFLSSGIIRSSEYTIKALVRVARTLRETHQSRAYIHLKTIPNASPDIDPKLAWALRNRGDFPVDVNTAPREHLLRTPGLGVRFVNRLLQARVHGRLRLDDLGRSTDSTQRLRTFVITDDHRPTRLLADFWRRVSPRPR